MKALKRILLVLGILVLLIVIIGFFLPSKVHVERSVVIKAPANMAFDQVNTLKNWEGWSPWHKLDPNMVLTYSGPASGVGAKYAWTSNDKNVGNGNMTITASMPDSFVGTAMDFMEHGKGTADFTFTKTPDGTKVTWGMNSDMGMNPIAHYFGMMMDKMVGSEFEKGLNNMKEIVEKMPAASSDIKVEETTSTDMHTLTKRVTCTLADLSKKYDEVDKDLKESMKKNGLNEAGPSFGIYYSFSPEKVDMAPGIQTDKLGKDDGDIKAMDMKAQNVLKVRYVGPYTKMKRVYDALDAYVKEHNKQVTGAPWEVYVTNTWGEKDSSKLITEVYFPVQ